jgi:hypothetical protein
MEEEYHDKIEFSGLEKKKRILASLRDLHQPLNMEKIEEEQKKYGDIIKQKNEQKKLELIQKLRENHESYDYHKFHGKYMEKVIENEILNKEQAMDKEERRMEYRNKMKDYDEIIKQKYKPITSRRKVEELEKVKAELTMNPRDKIRRSSPVIHSDMDDLKELALKRKRIFEWKNPLKPPTPLPRPEYEQKNFLKEFQDELKEEFERTGKRPKPSNRDWQHDLRSENLSKTEKFNMVREKASQLELTAKNRKRFLALNGGTAKDTELVNDMIFDSINAKLSILQNSVKKDGEE